MSSLIPEHLRTIYWIKPQLEVILVHNIAKENPPVLKVDRLLRKSIENKNGTRTVIVVGVMVHWTVPRGNGLPDKYERGRFGTKELYPYEIFKSGTQAMIEWDNYQQKKRGSEYKSRYNDTGTRDK